MSFNRRYWSIVAPLWFLTVLVVAVWAAVGSPTWANTVGWALGWGIFAVVLWWTLNTVRTYQRGQRALDPQVVLDQRLASGEISVDEYQRRRDVLRRGDPSGQSS